MRLAVHAAVGCARRTDRHAPAISSDDARRPRRWPRNTVQTNRNEPTENAVSATIRGIIRPGLQRLVCTDGGCPGTPQGGMSPDDGSTTRSRSARPTPHGWRGKRLRHHLHRQEGRRVIGDGLRPVAGITAPPEDEVGVQVVTTRNLRHRNAGRMGLRHDPALLVVLPKPVYTTRHRDPSSDGVH